jgi:molybdopterin-guanine dinucleotide biosynthesis protein A
MDAIVTAGGVPNPDEPLYPYTQGSSKATLDIAGKSMIQWVLDALTQAKEVESVVVIGLPEDASVECPKMVACLPNMGEMLDNIKGGMKKILELHPGAHHALLVSSDIPAITGEIVDWVIDAAMQTDDDVYYNVITRQVMEAHYPTSKRSYTHLKDYEICGGDMNVIRVVTVTENEAIWNKIISARKNVFKQAALIGYDTLVLLLFRLISLDSAVKTVSRRLDISGRAIICPYAEVGMDVDKPHQLEIIRQDLANRVN